MSCEWPPPDPAQLERRTEYKRLKSEGRAVAAREQPRPTYDFSVQQPLPRAEPRLQPQCLLLQRLPPELRIRVWTDVFNFSVGSRVRLERWRPVFGGEHMFDEEREVLDVDCFPYRLASMRAYLIDHPLGLLLTCRQIYIDAVPTLYSASEFIFTNPQELLSFQLVLPSKHLSKIRHLLIVFDGIDRLPADLFYFDFPANPICHPILRNWKEVLRSIYKEMPLLSSLKIWLLQHRQRAVDGQTIYRPWETTDKDHDVINSASSASSPKRQPMTIFEQRHRAFFDLLLDMVSTKQVSENPERHDSNCERIVSVDLNWWPEDVLGEKGEVSRRGDKGWSFETTLRCTDEMRRAIDALPQPRFTSLYD